VPLPNPSGVPGSGVTPQETGPDTVTATPAEVAVLPAASRATAVSVWAPGAAVAVSQDTVYGDEVASGPRSAPSSRNWTPATATSSLALAVTTTAPETVAPVDGEVIDTTGGVESIGVAETTLEKIPSLSLVSTDVTAIQYTWAGSSPVKTVSVTVGPTSRVVATAAAWAGVRENTPESAER